MAKGRDVRAFDYVNQPYDAVREALLSDAGRVFRDATRAAATRAREVAAGLHVNIAGIEIGAEIAIDVMEVEEEKAPSPAGSRTRVRLEWEAANAPRLFPEMKGTLSVYALTGTETQLDFEGTYEPPLGPLGRGIDAMIGHRVAEASIHRFVTDVAQYLRSELAGEG